MPTQNDDSSHPLRTGLLYGLVIAILLGIGWLVFLKQPAAQKLPQPPVQPGANEALTDAGRLELWQLKERGVGLLENHKYANAIEPLSQISATLPDDPLGPRDSVIALLLAMETNAAKADAAKAAMTELEKVQPDAVATSILAAKVLAQSGDAAAAIGRLQQATESMPQELTLWFELGQLQRDSPEADVRRQATASFLRAFELAPDNLAVLWNLLQSQADGQQDGLAETMRAARPLVEPLTPQATEAGVDLVREIDDALRAADVGRTEDLYRHAFIVANVIRRIPSHVAMVCGLRHIRWHMSCRTSRPSFTRIGKNRFLPRTHRPTKRGSLSNLPNHPRYRNCHCRPLSLISWSRTSIWMSGAI